MKTQTKNSNSQPRDRKSQNAKSGSRPGQQQVQRKAPRAERAPVAIGNKTFQSKPRYRNVGEGLCVIHSEYIGDILGNTNAFSLVNVFPINPGLPQSFPWLNQIASRYESYKFRKLNYRFMTERPTTESGYISIIPDYDPGDPPPTSKSNAFQYEGAAKCAPWENLVQRNEPRNMSKRKSYFVRSGNLTNTNADIATYDTGNIFICVGGNSGTVVLGELWCDYEVCFETPQVAPNIQNGFDSVRIESLHVGETAALPFGTSVAVVNSRNAILSYDGAVGHFIFLEPYEGFLEIDATGTVLSNWTIDADTSVTRTQIANFASAAQTFALLNLLVRASAGQILHVHLATGATFVGANLRLSPYEYLIQ